MIFEILFSYLLGAINFSYLLGRLLRVDISRYGDENLGATNLYYILKEKRKSYPFLIFLLAGYLDIIKAFIAAALFGPLYSSFVIVGHNFSIFSFILTRKLPSGVGFASTIGWALAADYRIVLIGLTMLPFLLYQRRYFKWERGHALSLFVYPFVGWIYTILFPHKKEIIYGLLIITIATFLARFYRLNLVLKQCSK